MAPGPFSPHQRTRIGRWHVSLPPVANNCSAAPAARMTRPAAFNGALAQFSSTTWRAAASHVASAATSVVGHTAKNSVRAHVFPLPSNSDIARRSRHVSKVPVPDFKGCASISARLEETPPQRAVAGDSLRVGKNHLAPDFAAKHWPEQLPCRALESPQLYLLDRREIDRAGVNLDAGQQVRGSEVLQVCGLLHHVLAR